MSKLRTPWIDPVSVHPKYFVNRTRLRSLLEDRILYKMRDALVLIGGKRGIGKSIFARTVLGEVAERFPNDVAPVVVAARMKSLINIAREYARGLVSAARELSNRLGWAASFEKEWFGPLQELAVNVQISRQVSSSSGREISASGELSGGLLTVFSGKGGFEWTEQRGRQEPSFEGKVRANHLESQKIHQRYGHHPTRLESP